MSFALLICLSVSYLLFSVNILRFRNDELTPAITGAASVAHFLWTMLRCVSTLLTRLLCDSAPSFCSCIPGLNPDSAPWPEARPRSHRRPCRWCMHAERSSVWAASLAESGRAERGSSVGWRRQKWSLQLLFFVPVALGRMLGTHRRFLCRSKMCFHSVAAVKRNCLYLILSNKRKSAPLHERSCWKKKEKVSVTT